MASIHISVENSDEQFTLQVDPPPAIGARFSVGDRLFEVTALEEGAGDDVSASVRQVEDS